MSDFKPTPFNPHDQDVFHAWINQPSTSQPYHEQHGMRVLVHRVYHERTKYTEYHAYPVADRNETSFMVDPLALSAGWPAHLD